MKANALTYPLVLFCVLVAACDGGGGESETTLPSAPMPVFPSSYENAKAIVLSDPNVPSPQALGIANPTSFHSSLAFADFFQEGAYSVVVTMLQYSSPAAAGHDLPSTIFFLRKNAGGDWVDATSKLLSDQTGCITARKTLIADFNGDGKPDVFFVCHGIDFAPFPGEKQRILLSQPDGTYSNVQLPYSGFNHGGSAADLDGDGRPDVVLASNQPQPYVLLNKGDGTSFTQVFDRLPSALSALTFELIDTEGNGDRDLFVGDAPPDGSTTLPNGVLRNDGTGHFLATPITKFPNPPGPGGAVMSLALDFAYVDGWLYMAQVGNSYQDYAVRKLRLSDLAISTPYQHQGLFSDGPTYQDWLYPRKSDRKILPQGANAVYPIGPESSFGWSIDF